MIEMTDVPGHDASSLQLDGIREEEQSINALESVSSLYVKFSSYTFDCLLYLYL